VHFLRFELTPPMGDALKAGAPLAMGVDHPAYRVEITALGEPMRGALMADLD
jgi:predicted amidohydrolase YtcJ